MEIKFGTDGIRGIAYEDLTCDVAYAVGNALGRLAVGGKALIGRDTRVSGKDLGEALIKGLTDAGADAVDCALMPTAGVAYLTRRLRCDFGVVISASHNPPEYNGIKVFDSQGFKISEYTESVIERYALETASKIGGGKSEYYPQGEEEYVDFLAAKGCDLSGMKILIDCSNGASSRIAPKVFEKLGASLCVVNASEDGSIINRDCGALNAHLLCDMAKRFDATFAFDGDSDRLIALDDNGGVVDGDVNMLVIGRYLKRKGLFTGNVAVGTLMTNMAIENEFKKMGVEFARADVGDKYVLRKIIELGGALGGEGSGHTLMLGESTTGDGVQTAVVLAKIIKESGKSFSELARVKLFPQITESVKVKDKRRVMADGKLIETLKEVQAELGSDGRVLLRPSGTEEKIRVTVECSDFVKAEKYVKKLTNIALKIEKMVLNQIKL